MARERRELIGSSEQFGKRHGGGEAPLRLLRQCHQHRRVENARRDGRDADPELREFARGRQGQRGDAALGGGIGGLSDLPFEGGNRGGHDDDAALAVRERAQALHVGSDEPHHVEGADEIDVDDAFEIGERHRAVAADDALGRSHAGAIDHDACRPVPLTRVLQRSARLLGIGHVAGHRVPADLVCQGARAVEIDVHDGDLGAGAGKFARGRRAEARGAAGHDRSVSFDVHD